MAYYTSMDVTAGYSAMYLIEDYPYKTADTVESIAQHLLGKMLCDQNLIPHELHSADWRTYYEKFLYEMRSGVTKLRYKAGI